ncbi:hypothetical protein ZIOFF_032625 [Zingiber officinale]|uniref:Nucleoside diphosphate kinase-like domain-containing protein n=1 Tax=Zingiber officinale TaxID=94328 RepID=A0A8J5GVW4_ZINOF|nr:hypothetical protein ZIOFF_032625 [Zingiber officinale]
MVAQIDKMITDWRTGGVAVEVTDAGDILSMVRLKALKTPGTVRMAAEENRRECESQERNVIHGSDSVESARKEFALWFPEGISEWQSNFHPWIYELANEIHEVGDAVNRRFRMNPNVIPMRPANAAKVIEKPASLLRLLRLFNIS